jgi:hypothetical protein
MRLRCRRFSLLVEEFHGHKGRSTDTSPPLHVIDAANKQPNLFQHHPHDLSVNHTQTSVISASQFIIAVTKHVAQRLSLTDPAL